MVRGRSFVIGALVDIPEPGAQGVLFAQGSRFGGHSLYVKDNRLHYVNSFVGIFEQMIVATEDLPIGDGPDPVRLVREGRRGPAPVATGILSLYHGDMKVGEGRIKTQPGGYMIAGEGLAIGRDVGDPVTQDYPGERPVPLHRRHDQASRRRRQRRAVHRPRTRSPRDAHARDRTRVTSGGEISRGLCATSPLAALSPDRLKRPHMPLSVGGFARERRAI